jgi:hypothetical protein
MLHVSGGQLSRKASENNPKNADAASSSTVATSRATEIAMSAAETGGFGGRIGG